MKRVDVAVIGAGAAGLFCAARAGRRGRSVLLVDHAAKVAEKIRISGGGRCNFTNRDATPAQFHSANPAFCRSALTRYTPQDFIALVQRHRIPFHEKHHGQLFCDESSRDIVDLLLRECEDGGVERWQPCAVASLAPAAGGWSASAVSNASGAGAAAADASWRLETDRGPVEAARVVVATGGLTVPKIGASDFGLRIARAAGHAIIEPRPALVPLVFDAAAWAPWSGLAGIALEVGISAGPRSGHESGHKSGHKSGHESGHESGRGERRATGRFVEDLLFTHRGLSGPAILQASSYWRPGEAVSIALAPGRDWDDTLLQAKQASRRQLVNELAQYLPHRLAVAWLAQAGLPAERPLPELPDKALRALAQSLSRWNVVPSGTEGWAKAEVMAGGVDTREIDSRTMESRRAPGLHFIGEVLDVTGWLGGYNFQWAWSSAAACADGV